MKLPLLPVHIMTSRTLSERLKQVRAMSNSQLQGLLRTIAQMSTFIDGLPPEIVERYMPQRLRKGA